MVGVMEKLIEALTIMLKYGNPAFPTTCEHDVLYVPTYDYEKFSPEDIARLEELGFTYNEDGGEGFMSTWYGSC
jgi:hypothetical protein